MDERIHDRFMSSNFACPSVGPPTVFTTTTSDHVAKPYSTPMCDEYPTCGTSNPTKNGTVSKPRAHSP